MFQFRATAALLLLASPLAAAVQTKVVEYQHGDLVLEGLLAWDDAQTSPRPGVLVVHEWWGNNEYSRGRAKQLAELGYVAFAADMYGKGRSTTHPEQAGAWAGEVMKNIPAGLERAKLGLDQLLAHPGVDKEHVAAIGYCFGGSAVTFMAYSGFDLDGVVSFHGSLPAAPEGTASPKAKILIAHGADDAFVSAETIATFTDRLRAIGADWQMVSYGGAKHSFTNPAADNSLPGAVYDAAADQRSWAAMQSFFDEIFAAK